MKKLYKPWLNTGVWAVIFLIGLSASSQVVRNYTVTYSDNLHGGHTVFGNTILADGSTYMNYFTINATNGTTSIYGNDTRNMQYVDIDDSSSTFNSSSANLVLPAGSNTIKFARLYWGGRIDNDHEYYANRRTVKIRKAGAYQTITAPTTQIDERNFEGTDHYAYQAYIDVTAFVNSGGAGTYTVANIAVSTGNMNGGGGFYGGWAIVVVYENPALQYSSVRAYDGFLQVYDDGSPTTQSITLTGLNVPGTLTNASDAYMSTMAWEGDANLAASGDNEQGDYMKVNGIKVSNAINPITNFWNGTISKNGVFIETKNPNFKNQMGIDIDEQEVGTGYDLPEGTSNIIIEFGTEADQYFPSVFAFTIKAKDPTVILDKTGTTSLVPYQLLNPNEEITYTLSGINTGDGLAHNCIITDTIPNNLTFKPGSLNILQSPGGIKGYKTDVTGDDQAAFDSVMVGTIKKRFVKFYIGDGATATAGGHLHKNETYSVEFKCMTPANATVLNSVANTGRITGHAEDGTPFVDDGTFVIGPEGSPLSVKLTLFAVTKEGNNAYLRWITESEEDNDRFEIERSNDGTAYRVVGTIAGSGTTTDTRTYAFTDPLFSTDKVVYYRLRIVDKDEAGTYSKVLVLRVNDIISSFSVYPNPFTDQLKLQISSSKDVQVQLRITNAAGQTVLNRMIRVSSGLNIVVLKDIAAQQAGLYVLEMITENDRLVQKLIRK